MKDKEAISLIFKIKKKREEIKRLRDFDFLANDISNFIGNIIDNSIDFKKYINDNK